MKKSERYGAKVQLNKLQSGDITYYAVNNNVWKKVGRKSAGITERKAFEVWAEIDSQLRHGKDITKKDPKRLTFDDLAVVFLDSKINIKSHTRYKQNYYNHISPLFGDLPLPKLKDILIVEFISMKIFDGCAKGSIRQYLTLINSIMNYAVETEIIKVKPFKKVEQVKVDNTRLKYLSSDEVVQLTSSVVDDKVLNFFVSIALQTGARANSILSLRKKDVNVENRTVTLRDFKRNNNYIGYLSELTFDVVVESMESLSANSFVVSMDGKETKYHSVYSKLTKIFEKFNHGLDKNDRANRVVIHTLRHTFASHLAIKGVSIQEIQKLMNHKDIKQTLKYAKLMPDSGRSHAENLYEEVA